MRLIGRSLQILAMVLLPLAIVLQLGGLLGRSIGVSDMLMMLLFGIGLFYAGRLMEGLAQR